MRLVKAIILDFKGAKSGTNATTGRSWEIYEFIAHETDFDGARIPVTLTAMDAKVRDILMNLKGQETMLPFTAVKLFNGKETYTISDDVLRISKAGLDAPLK